MLLELGVLSRSITLSWLPLDIFMVLEQHDCVPEHRRARIADAIRREAGLHTSATFTTVPAPEVAKGFAPGAAATAPGIARANPWVIGHANSGAQSFFVGWPGV